jgi:hypothetical protein
VLSGFFEKSGENSCADRDLINSVFALFHIKIIKPVKGYVAKGKSYPST